MNRIIMLIGGAMLFLMSAANAQLNIATIENKASKKRTELGLTLQDYDGFGLFVRREIKTNTFLRLSGKLSSTSYLNKSHIGIGLEKQIAIGNKGKWELYHGANLNFYKNSWTFDNNYPMKENTLTVGYRLGMRYNINKRLFIGAEINPQIGLAHSDYYIQRNISHGAFSISSNNNNLQPIYQLGATQLTFGVKF